MTAAHLARYGDLLAAVTAQARSFGEIGVSAEHAAKVIAKGRYRIASPGLATPIGRDAAILVRISRVVSDRVLDRIIRLNLQSFAKGAQSNSDHTIDARSRRYPHPEELALGGIVLGAQDHHPGWAAESVADTPCTRSSRRWLPSGLFALLTFGLVSYARNLAAVRNKQSARGCAFRLWYQAGLRSWPPPTRSKPTAVMFKREHRNVTGLPALGASAAQQHRAIRIASADGHISASRSTTASIACRCAGSHEEWSRHRGGSE